MKKKPFYITTTLPFLNADPHIGHATEFVRADVIARVKKLAGYDVFFNTGTDEHGIKIYRKAKEQNLDPQTYVDGYAAKFKALLPALGILPEVTFTRTTDKHHEAAAQEFWKLAKKNGFIYKKNYSVKYCIGCELEKMESELTNGRCPIHPLQELEIIEEENYFFKFSAFQKQLLELYADNPTLVIPDTRLNEIKAFVARGLEDFSISRLREKMPWGIPVPDDDAHVMYVWFDALVNYISAVGWPDRLDSFKKWCVDTGGMVQYCGKDNLRQQSAMWQAMLMSAGLPSSKSIIIDGFITGEGGIKMSKSLGNTVDPMEIINEYGTDAFRYYALREMHPFEDSPFTEERFKEAYNAHLANGIGNLVSRVMKMAEANLSESVFDKDHPKVTNAFVADAVEKFDLQSAMNIIWRAISMLDEAIQKDQPFKLVKEDKEKGIRVIKGMVEELFKIAKLLEPFLPETSQKIQDLVKANKMPTEPLFMRK
jgi:methionyl-tRNA synthetase